MTLRFVALFSLAKANGPPLQGVSLTRGRLASNPTKRNETKLLIMPRMPLAWDPPELPPFWWLPLTATAQHDEGALASKLPPSPSPLKCDPRQRAVHMEGATGRRHNFLIAWATELQTATTRSPPRAVILSAAFHEFIGGRFDVVLATRSWACVETTGRSFMEARTRGRLSNRSIDIVLGHDLFKTRQNEAGAAFLATAISQLLLRPAPALRSALESFLKAKALRVIDTSPNQGRGNENYDADYDDDGRMPFVAVHLRGLEGKCEKRYDRQAAFPDIMKQYDGGHSGAAVCRMSVDYVSAVLRAEGISWAREPQHDPIRDDDGRRRSHSSKQGGVHRIVVCHDGQDRASFNHLKAHFGALTFKGPKGADSASVDMLIMLQSSFFIGNPASSFSRNVAAVRRHELRRESRSNLWGEPLASLQVGSDRTGGHGQAHA